MVDLSTYRARIGLHSQRTYFCRTSLFAHVSRWSSAIRVSILFIFCLNAALLPLDGRSDRKNPGPKQVTPFVYNSDQEKTLFLKSKSLELFHTKCTSHLAFLEYCRSKGQIPSGLTTSLPMSAARPDHILNQKVSDLQRDISFASLDIIIDHYKNRTLPKLEEDMNQTKEELRTISDTSRYQYLLSTIKNFAMKERRYQDEKKRKNY